MAKKKRSKFTEDDTCPACGRFIKDCDNIYSIYKDDEAFDCSHCGARIYVDVNRAWTFRAEQDASEDDFCPAYEQFIENCDSMYEPDPGKDGQSFICPHCRCTVFVEFEVDVTFWTEEEVEIAE